jgi:RimJ/RimL family protein N-acetyltransferase
MTPPTLTTNRLILRPPTLEHYPASLALWGDPVVARFTGGTPRRPDDVWDRLLKKVGQWTLFGFGAWIVERRSDGRAVGEAGFLRNVRLLDPEPESGWPTDPEVGWAFLPEVHGQGIASEAVAAALAWGDAQGLGRTICLIDADNEASLRLAERQGFTVYDTPGFHGRPSRLLERFPA